MPRPEIQKFWNLAPSQSTEGVVDMYVYGVIMDEASWFGDASDVITHKFITDLQEYKDIARINVHINSPGGVVWAAVAIGNQLNKHNAEVHAYIDGMCASAATILALRGADKVHMSNLGLFMVHNGRSRIEGEAKDMVAASERLTKVNKIMADEYARKTGMKVEDVQAMMDAETYLDVYEALEYGYVDSMMEADEEEEEKEKEKMIMYNTETSHLNYYGVDVALGDFDEDKLLNKINKISDTYKLTKLEFNTKKGEKSLMSYEEIIATLPEESQAIIKAHVEAQVTEATEGLEATNSVLNSNLQKANQSVEELTAKLEGKADPAVDPEEAILASMSEEAKTAYLKAKEVAAEATAQLAKKDAEEAYNSFKTDMAKYENLPIQEKHMEAMFALSKTSEEAFATIQEVLASANESAKDLFKEVGSGTGKDVEVTAKDEYNQKIADYMKANEGISYTNAATAVAKEDPALYDRYVMGN